jgi:hypothetical protein
VRIRIEGLQAIAMAELLIRIKPHIQSAAEQGALVTVTEAQVRIHPITHNSVTC